MPLLLMESLAIWPLGDTHYTHFNTHIALLLVSFTENNCEPVNVTDSAPFTWFNCRC